jgi:hypothetical protein
MGQRVPFLATTRKAKIGKDYSWPVGAEAISAALLDVPQRELLSLAFGPDDRFHARSGLPPLVMEARYYFRGPSVSSPNRPLFQPTWEIRISAVPRTEKHQVKTLLLEQGIPELIKPWLFQMWGPDRREGSAGIYLLYEAAEERLICKRYGKVGPALAR